MVSETSTPSDVRFTLKDEEPDEEEPRVDAAKSSAHETYRVWWQTVLEMQFDDPEQSPPVLHFPNNVRARLPWPKLWIAAYRGGTGPKAECGVGLGGDPQERRAVWDMLGQDIEGLMKELPGAIPITWADAPGLSTRKLESEFANATAEREWLIQTLNGFVNALRPRMKRLLEQTHR